MPYQPKVKSPYLHLSPFLSPEQSSVKIQNVNYLVNHKKYPKAYHKYCDSDPECKYNDLSNKIKLENNLGCLYGRIKAKTEIPDHDTEHLKQIRYRVAYTKKCINLLHTPPLKKTPSDFMTHLRKLLKNVTPYSTNETFLNKTVSNTSEVFGKAIKTSDQEIVDRQQIQRRTYTNKKEYRERMIELYIKAIVDSANEIISDIEKKGKDSEYFAPVFGNVLNTKTEIHEKKGTILIKLTSQADKYAFEDMKYKYNHRLNSVKDLKFDQKAEQIIKTEINKLIDDLPQLKDLEMKRAAEAEELRKAKAAAEAEELRKVAAARASKSQARTKEQDIKKLDKKIREIEDLEVLNKSKLTSEQRTKLASKQEIIKTLQKLKGSKGGRRRTRKIRR
jgi:hypothetical protein